MKQKSTTRILAIETSCDESAAAVIENGCHVLASTVASQMELHARYGGVFPEVASRQHILSVVPVVEQTLTQAHLALTDIDAIAATRGPGLAGSLLVGLNLAKGLALGSGLPLVGINHLEGHIYSAWISEAKDGSRTEPKFPLVALLVSGGHTQLILMTGHLQYKRLGASLDDAAGEAFDKVARLLGLGYPGGPAIQEAAASGDPQAYELPRAWLDGSFDFSFSGLKTAVLHKVRKIESDKKLVNTADMAASFQAAVVDVLFHKTMQAAEKHKAREVLVAGGVSANQALRQAFQEQKDFPVHIPPLNLCTDNAAMVAAAGHYRFINGQMDGLDIDVLPTWPLS